MAHWHDVAVTSEGVAMLNEMMAGHPLQLTSAYGGTGVVDAAALGEQTAMVDQKQKLALIDEQDGPDGKTVTVQISSAGNDAEYLLRQIGVYAKLSKDGAEEKLLFLMQDEGVIIPAGTEGNFLLEIYCTLRIGKDAKLAVAIDPSGIVTIQRMKDAIDKYRTLWEDSDPTAATVGTVGQHYLNIVTKKEFVCVTASEEGYIWQASGANTADDITVGGKPLTEVLGTVEPEEGTSAPTEQTAGVVGQKYTDTSTGKVYTCIAVSLGEDGGTRYTWVEGSLGTLADIRTALLDVSTTLEHKASLQPRSVVYVTKSGSDETGDGSEGAPYLTIQKAVDSIGHWLDRDVKIEVGAGTYDEDVSVWRCHGSGLHIRGAKEGDETCAVQVKTITLSDCRCEIQVSNFRVYGTSSQKYALRVAHCEVVHLYSIECITPDAERDRGAVYAAYSGPVYLIGCVISNQVYAIHAIGSLVYLDRATTGEDNTTALWSGSGWGSMGAIIFKGQSTIAGAEVKYYGGQIF